MVEGDGVNISLQREEEKRTEIKVGIAYEGWDPVGKGRYRLKEKTTYTGIMTGRGFWPAAGGRLISLREQGQLGLWVNSIHKPKICGNTVPRFKLRPESDKPSEDKYRAWLETGLPALYGPHHNHPWAQTLSAIRLRRTGQSR